MFTGDFTVPNLKFFPRQICKTWLKQNEIFDCYVVKTEFIKINISAIVLFHFMNCLRSNIFIYTSFTENLCCCYY